MHNTFLRDCVLYGSTRESITTTWEEAGVWERCLKALGLFLFIVKGVRVAHIMFFNVGTNH